MGASQEKTIPCGRSKSLALICTTVAATIRATDRSDDQKPLNRRVLDLDQKREPNVIEMWLIAKF